jgi:hypothetical protein
VKGLSAPIAPTCTGTDLVAPAVPADNPRRVDRPALRHSSTRPGPAHHTAPTPPRPIRDRHEHLHGDRRVRPAGAGRRQGRRELRHHRLAAAPRGRAEPRPASARLRPRCPAHAGGVGGGNRVPHPDRPHHRPPSPGVHPALRRTGPVHAHGRDQRPGHRRGRGVHRRRPVLRRRRPGGPLRRRHRGRRERHALPGGGHRPRHGRHTGTRGPHRRGRPTTASTTSSTTGTASPAAVGCGRTSRGATGSGRWCPRRIRSRPTARWATYSPQRAGRPCARRTCTSRSPQPGTGP